MKEDKESGGDEAKELLALLQYMEDEEGDGTTRLMFTEDEQGKNTLDLVGIMTMDNIVFLLLLIYYIHGWNTGVHEV